MATSTASADGGGRAAVARRPGHRFIILTGLSGSGKSQAIRALASQVPRNRTVIALSEAVSLAEYRRLRGACDAVAVGAGLLSGGDVAAALRQINEE